MSASELEETGERLAQCFSYIRDVAGDGRTVDSVSLSIPMNDFLPPDQTADARPPEWLVTTLRSMWSPCEPFWHENPEFEVVMTPAAIPGPIITKVPMIRCNCCHGGLYPPGPGGTADDFKVHLSSASHR